MAKQYARVPLKIASIYAVIGCLWILFSDRGVALIVHDPELFTLVSMVKGWLYVLLTAVLLYWLIRRHIAAARAVEDRLHDSEVKYRDLFDAANDAIFIIDLDGHVIDVNRSAYTRLGYTKDELLTLHISQLDPPEFSVRVPERLKMIRDKGVAVFESAHLRKDGSAMAVEVSSKLHEYEGRQVYFSIIRDIAERKQAEQLLRESEDRYRRFSSLTTDYVYSCRRCNDEPFRVQWLGGAIEEITGFSGEEILTRGCWLPLVHGDDVKRVSSRLQALGPGVSSVEEFRIVRKDGAIRWLHEACRCEQGAVPGEQLLFGTSQDITDRKVAEAAVIELNEHLEHLVAERTAELQRSNEDLASFSYAVSHEIRAPIARLSGFSTMLGEVCSGDGETAFMAARIANASRQLQAVVDSILRLSRLAKMELSLQPLDLSELVTRKLQQQLKESPDRQVELVVMPGVTVIADPNLLAICMDNLLGNALKYSGQTLHARVEFGAYDESGRTVCFVRDNGTGFDMTFEEKLYAPFERLHQHQEFPGMGIGLATVKRIIERHGGEIWADARVGEGATFYFTLGGSVDAR